MTLTDECNTEWYVVANRKLSTKKIVLRILLLILRAEFNGATDTSTPKVTGLTDFGKVTCR